MAGPGLYANIHAKRKRGGKMRKKGAKGAPKASDFAAAKRTAKKATGGSIGKVIKRAKQGQSKKPKGPGKGLDRFTPPSSYPGKKKKQIKSYEGYA